MVNIETLAVLGAGAGIAGFVDTLAGGGGLITVPLLLLTGRPPLQVLATNKLQGTFGTLSATVVLLRKHQIFVGDVRAGFAAAFAGGVLGALTVKIANAGALDILIPIILAGIALYFLFAPRAAEVGGKARLCRPAYLRTIVPAIGFYDGFMGPGTGSFFALAGVALRGEPLLKARLCQSAQFCQQSRHFGSLSPRREGGLGLWSGDDLWPNFGRDGRFTYDDPWWRPAHPATDRRRLLCDDPPLYLAKEVSACPLTP